MKKDRSILLAGTFPPIRRKQEIPLLTPSRRMSAGMLHALGSWAKMKERDTEWLLRGFLAWWGDEERRCPMDSLCGHLLWSHGLLVWESPLIPHSKCIPGPPSKKKKNQMFNLPQKKYYQLLRSQLFISRTHLGSREESDLLSFP